MDTDSEAEDLRMPKPLAPKAPVGPTTRKSGRKRKAIGSLEEYTEPVTPAIRRNKGRRVSTAANRTPETPVGTNEDDREKSKGQYYIEGIEQYIPPRFKAGMQASKTIDDWSGKARFLEAILFMRFRHIGDKVWREIMQAVQPTKSGVVTLKKGIEILKTLLRELQEQASNTHETLSKAFLDTPRGREHMRAADMLR